MVKKKKMKTVIILIIWTIIIILIPLMASKIEDSSFKNNKSYISSEFDIENYNIILDVDKDNKIDVTEQFAVNIPNNKEFNGIYKSIPLWQKYYNKNTENKKKIKITNLRAIGEKFVLNNSNDRIGIRIGSTRTNVNPGLHTYTIKYRYDMGTDTNNDFDELIFNMFDNYEDTTIKDMNIMVNMPKEFANENIVFLKGKEDITNNINYVVNEKTISANFNDYILNESITLKMILPNGYFVGGTYNYGFIGIIFCIIIIVFSIISFVLWTRYGKDYDKKCKTVEFYPPEDLDSSQIGYIYGEKSIKKLTAALIIQLASKGYISIEEIEKNKFKIVNTGKNKSNLKQMSINEQIVYLELFRNGDTNILSEDKAFSNVFEKIKSTLENTVDKKVNDVKSRKMMNLTIALLIISIVLWNLSYIYIRDLEPRFNWLYITSLISIFITGFFSIIMERKTSYGEMIIAKILGFKNYLSIAEKNEIDTLAKENPNYFYDLLPYTYVLGVSEKWIGLFDKKNVPNINIENIPLYENNLFMIISE